MGDLLETIELETGNNPAAAVIWMHGLGADGNDFVAIVNEFDLSAAPPIRFVFPHAPMMPVTINNGHVMRAWYDVSFGDLEGKTILVLRDGCGDLVDLWLDHVIPLNTGAQRKKFARYQTVTEPQEAILPVFFGESEACVVSEAAYGAVAAQNPDQFLKRLLKLEVSDSEDLPSHVVVCSNSLPLETQSRVIYWAERMTWDFGYQKGGFVAAEAHPEAFANLSGLVSGKVPAANSISEPAQAAPPANTIPLKQKRLP